MHITCRSGRICSLEPDDRGRIKVDVVIDGGDSGTPCFSMDRNLTGMICPPNNFTCREVKSLPETNPLPSRVSGKVLLKNLLKLLVE